MPYKHLFAKNNVNELPTLIKKLFVVIFALATNHRYKIVFFSLLFDHSSSHFFRILVSNLRKWMLLLILTTWVHFHSFQPVNTTTTKKFHFPLVFQVNIWLDIDFWSLYMLIVIQHTENRAEDYDRIFT